ncbi:hypothetical protein AAY84_04280 [Serratia marcescens]|nr:hypothetical protein AAY84_04280 [Serratia marcescens]
MLVPVHSGAELIRWARIVQDDNIVQHRQQYRLQRFMAWMWQVMLPRLFVEECHQYAVGVTGILILRAVINPPFHTFYTFDKLWNMQESIAYLPYSLEGHFINKRDQQNVTDHLNPIFLLAAVVG